MGKVIAAIVASVLIIAGSVMIFNSRNGQNGQNGQNDQSSQNNQNDRNGISFQTPDWLSFPGSKDQDERKKTHTLRIEPLIVVDKETENDENDENDEQGVSNTILNDIDATSIYGEPDYHELKCPGSKSLLHAKCAMVYHFDNHCKNVKKEIEERIKHNDDRKKEKGQYELIETSSNTTTGSRTVSKSHGGFKDLFTFTYTEHDINNGEHTHCTVTACSESQIISFMDLSTNFCNMYNLVCNDDQGCKKRSKEIHYLGASFKMCPFHNVERCTA